MLGMLRRMMNLRASSRLLAAVPVLACVSCQPVSAPKDVDGLSHFFVDNFEVGTDDELADGIVKLNAALKGSTMTDPIKNVIDTKLTLDEVAVIPEQRNLPMTLGHSRESISERPPGRGVRILRAASARRRRAAWAG
jgi:hypothetical protein